MAVAGIKKVNICKAAALFVIALVIFGLSFLRNNNTKSNQIKTNYELETPGIKDRKVADFYLWTKEDPLFTSPNFNSTFFYATIKALEEEEQAYLQLIDKKDKIFPISFLKSIVEVDDAHKKFIKNPSRENANLLIDKYQKSAEKYQIEINALSSTVNSINFKTFDRENIVLLNTIADNSIVLNDLRKIKENALEIKKEIDIRKKCLELGVGCKRPASDFSIFKILDKKYNFSKKDLLPKNILEPIPGFLADGLWTGPYIVSTGCHGWTENYEPKPQLFYLIRVVKDRTYKLDSNRLTELYEKLATTNYYSIVGSAANQASDINNLNRRIVLESNVYDCFDPTYKSSLTSIDQMYRKYKDKKIFHVLLNEKNLSQEMKSFFEVGDKLEKVFFESQFPSENAGENLANYYGLFYKNIIIWKNDPIYKKDNLVQKLFITRNDYLTRSLEYKRGLGDIDQTFAQANDSFSSLLAKYLVNGFGKSEGLLYITYVVRSMYGISYLSFSSSVYRSDILPSYIPKVRINSNGGLKSQYISYQEAKKYYTEDIIASWKYDVSIDLQDKYNQYLMTSK